MLKVIHNNMIIDVLSYEKYVRYLPKSGRFIGSDKQTANAVLGSNNDTIYHIEGKDYNFPMQIKTVRLVKIEQEEYEILTSQLKLQEQQQADLREEVTELKRTVTRQNELLEQLLSKLQ